MAYFALIYETVEDFVAQFAQNDPYVSNGLVLPWAVVIGNKAQQPI